MIDNPIDNINNMNNIKKNYMDSALGTAFFILRCINEGQSRKEIIQNLDNNEQLVSVWIQYLKAIGWLKEDTKRNLLASDDGKSRIQQYEVAISKLHDINTSRQNESDPYQENMVCFFQSGYIKFVEATVMHCWNCYWSWILPVTNRITETYAAAVNRLVDDTKNASKAANKVLSANMKLFNIVTKYM
jgi:hypothetical protein